MDQRGSQRTNRGLFSWLNWFTSTAPSSASIPIPAIPEQTDEGVDNPPPPYPATRAREGPPIPAEDPPPYQPPAHSSRRNTKHVLTEDGLLSDEVDLRRLLDEKVRPDFATEDDSTFTLRHLDNHDSTADDTTSYQMKIAEALYELAYTVKQMEPMTPKELFTVREYTKLAVRARNRTRGAKDQRSGVAGPQDIKNAAWIVDNDGESVLLSIELKSGGTTQTRSRRSRRRLVAETRDQAPGADAGGEDASDGTQ